MELLNPAVVAKVANSRQYVNEWVLLLSNQTLFSKTNGGPIGLWFTYPCSNHFFKKIFYLFILGRGGGKEKERERNISVWLPLVHPLPGT